MVRLIIVRFYPNYANSGIYCVIIFEINQDDSKGF